MANKDTGAFIGGVLLGAAVGSLVGLLLAPRSEQNRRALKRTADGPPRAADTGEAQEQIDRLMHSARRSLDETIGKLNEAIEASQSLDNVFAPDASGQSAPPVQGG